MNYSEKLIRAYKKNYKPNMKNAYIKLKARNYIAVWSNDPLYVSNMIFAKVNNETINLGFSEKKIRENAKKYNLIVRETNEKDHRFTACIPMGAILDVAMNVDTENADIDYIAKSAVIKYNDLMYYTDTMDNNELKNYFMHVEET